MRTSVKRFLGVLVAGWGAWALAASGHPGWGIVQDAAGNVYFTDTHQVWQVTPEDRLVLVVPRVHTHELALDAEGNLLGEHLWYEGDATGKWGHRIWIRKPDGTVRDLIPPREGFRRDFSFVRDAQGNQYWVHRVGRTVIKRRDSLGKVSTHATGPFRSLERMVATPDGWLALMDAGSLRLVSPQGAVRTLVPVLTGINAPAITVAELNYHMGIWQDAGGRYFVAANAERHVLRIDAAGVVSVVDRSAAPWAPSGGMVDRQGRLWILEHDPRNRVRVRRTDSAGTVRIFAPDAASGSAAR